MYVFWIRLVPVRLLLPVRPLLQRMLQAQILVFLMRGVVFQEQKQKQQKQKQQKQQKQK
jgi:carbon starvation protein CstA